MLKISIITISYNSANTIERAIKSVISQDYDNFEYIIIDGGSTDETMKIIEKYKERISYFISEKDEGISDAFNKGIMAASGDYIGIVNSDDELYPGALSSISKQCSGEADIFRGYQTIYNEITGQENVLYPTREFNKLPFRFHVCHMSTYISKRAFAKYGCYRKDFSIAMDLELIYRMHNQGADIEYIDVNVGKFYVGGISTINLKKKRQEVAKILQLNGGSKMAVAGFKVLLYAKDFIKRIIKQ